MKRRSIIVGGIIVLGMTAALYFFLRPVSPPSRMVSSPSLESEMWRAFASRFASDGRIIDRDNGGISHSEGQGYGMLLAEAAADRAAFEAIWLWTRNHLLRADMLFSWRFGPCDANPDGCVTDVNNATDGDILIAWALLRAAERWNIPEYNETARRIVSALEKLAVVKRDDRFLLLPGLAGFVEAQAITVNLSYWIFPAFKAFATKFDAPIWRDVAESGRDLIGQARFGPRKLPPDWLEVDTKGVRPSPKFEPLYGFNAIRIPLHLVWAGETSNALFKPYLDFWAAAGNAAPAWVNLADDSTAEYGLSTGAASIASITIDRVAGRRMTAAAMPTPGKDDGYFSWSMALLTRVALRELDP